MAEQQSALVSKGRDVEWVQHLNVQQLQQLAQQYGLPPEMATAPMIAAKLQSRAPAEVQGIAARFLSGGQQSQAWPLAVPAVSAATTQAMGMAPVAPQPVQGIIGAQPKSPPRRDPNRLGSAPTQWGR